jgi:hypothetical protein
MLNPKTIRALQALSVLTAILFLVFIYVKSRSCRKLRAGRP